MPTVSVFRNAFLKRLEVSLTDDQVDDLCFEFGVELDEVTSQKKMLQKEKGNEAAADAASDEPIYKIEVPANRYDLLCLEGLSRAFRVFLGKEPLPNYHLIAPPNNKRLRMIIKKDVLGVRPHVVCAVLRNIRFDEANYKSFIELQDKLHHNICRQRTLVSVGTHDLDTIQGPFTYEAHPPTNINFVALNQTTSMTADKLMVEFEKGHLGKYLHIIRDKPLYPVIYDSKRVVLSLPPIINGEHSKIKLSTRNVFIEVTATDLTKAKIVLDTIVAMFSEYCDDKYGVEPVEVEGADGKVTVYPDFSPVTQSGSIEYINRSLGLKLTPQEIVKYLGRMSLPATSDNSKVIVTIPPTRSDILHACDIMEDVAIAYGFNKLPMSTNFSSTIATQFPINKLTHQLRNEIAQAGFIEVLTFALCSIEDNYKRVCKKEDGAAVQLANPKTDEFQIGRTSLLPGLLKTLNQNKKKALPLKLFEVSDVMFVDSTTDVGARNRRHLAAVYTGVTSGFAVVHGLLDRVMQVLNVAPTFSENAHKSKLQYKLVPTEDATYFTGRGAAIYVNDKKVGMLGVVHPLVLSKDHFDLSYPCSAFEMDIEWCL